MERQYLEYMKKSPPGGDPAGQRTRTVQKRSVCIIAERGAESKEKLWHLE